MAELEANGVRIGFDDVGEGKPIVCLGGTGMPAYAWQLAYVPALVDTGYRVVAVDGRGVGRSSAPPPPYSIAEIAEILSLLRVDVLQHDDKTVREWVDLLGGLAGLGRQRSLGTVRGGTRLAARRHAHPTVAGHTAARPGRRVRTRSAVSTGPRSRNGRRDVRC